MARDQTQAGASVLLRGGDRGHVQGIQSNNAGRAHMHQLTSGFQQGGANYQPGLSTVPAMLLSSVSEPTDQRRNGVHRQTLAHILPRPQLAAGHNQPFYGSNGLVNGGQVRPQVNGQANGQANGQVHGHVNGQANGQVNGQANGQVNGHVNGLYNSQANAPTSSQAQRGQYYGGGNGPY